MHEIKVEMTEDMLARTELEANKARVISDDLLNMFDGTESAYIPFFRDQVFIKLQIIQEASRAILEQLKDIKYVHYEDGTRTA